MEGLTANMQHDTLFAILSQQPQQHLQHQPLAPGRAQHERPARPRQPRSPTDPADPDEISIGKVIQGKKPPSSTKFAALGYLLGREPQPLQDPGKSRRAARRTHHRSIPWYNFMAAPRSFRTHANTYSTPHDTPRGRVITISHSGNAPRAPPEQRSLFRGWF